MSKQDVITTFTEEHVDKFVNGELQVGDFSDEIASHLNEGRFPIEEKAEQEAVIEPEKIDVNGKGTKNEIHDDDPLKSKYYKKSNIANSIAQKLSASERAREEHEFKLKSDDSYRAEYFKKLGIDLPKKETVDYERDENGNVDAYSESNPNIIADRLDTALQRIEAFEQKEKLREQQARERELAEATKGSFADIDTASEMFGLGGKSFEEANNEYAQYLSQFGDVTDPNVQRNALNYAKNPGNFTGINVAIPENLDRTLALIPIYNTMDKFGVDAKKAFLLNDYELKATQAKEAKKGFSEREQAEINRLDTISNQPKILDPQSEPGFNADSDEGIGSELERLSDIGSDNWTADQEARFDELLAKATAQMG